MNLLYNHLSVNADGHLSIGGMDTVELAREFGTPAYIMDEDAIRAQMRTYLNAAHTYFGADALPLYASKALCFAGIYRIAAEEGMGASGWFILNPSSVHQIGAASPWRRSCVFALVSLD